MIGAAGALVLLGLGLFVAGMATGTTGFYWLCVGACVAAGLLLALARLRGSRAAGAPPSAPSPQRQDAGPGATGVAGGQPAPVPGAGGPVAGADEPSSAARTPRAVAAPPTAGDPPAEDVEVTDLLLVVDLRDEVLVVDERPRYHLAGCSWLTGRPTVPLPVDEARSDGFTPCARCAPDRNLAERERGRRAGRTP